MTEQEEQELEKIAEDVASGKSSNEDIKPEVDVKVSSEYSPELVEKPTVKPKLEKNCRMCKLSVDNPKLYNWLTKQAMEGQPYGTIRTNLIKYIEEKGLNFKVMTRKSIWRHYEKHMYAKDATVVQRARDEWVSSVGAPLVKQKILEEFNAESFDEYEELCKLFVHFREVSNRIYEYDSALKVMNQNTGHETWSQNKIQTYVSMVNAKKSILSEIAKMRQGDKLVSIAAKFVIENFTRAIVHKLQAEFESFMTVMKRQDVNEELLDAFRSISTDRLGKIIVDEASNVMSATHKEFKLPN